MPEMPILSLKPSMPYGVGVTKVLDSCFPEKYATASRSLANALWTAFPI
jgi:hypothetical protein